jgi:hypothetical protein
MKHHRITWLFLLARSSAYLGRMAQSWGFHLAARALYREARSTLAVLDEALKRLEEGLRDE